MRMTRLGCGVAGVLLVAASSAHADPAARSPVCNIPTAREAREQHLHLAYSIEYGNSTNELVLYRLMRGVDRAALPGDLWSLPWSGPHTEDVDTDEQKTAHFENLLLPAETLQQSRDAVAEFQSAQLFLQMQGLRSYRPEAYIGEEPADDWWLDEPESSPYRRLEIADWLQSMAASDNLHRIHRGYGKRSYRPLIASWTYFDPRALHSQAYARVTRHAVERWEASGDLLWEMVVYARTLPADQLAEELIERFLRLHDLVKSCAATPDQYLAYPLLRFHTLRLLFARSVESADSRQAIDLFNESTFPGTADPNATIGDVAIAERVARLYISNRVDHLLLELMNHTAAENAPAMRVLTDVIAHKSWMFADTLARYADLARNRTPDQYPDEYEVWVLNGLSAQSLFKLAKSEAFDAEWRLRLAKTAWTRAYLLGKRDLDQEILEFLVQHDSSSALAMRPMLSAASPKRDHLALIVLLRDKTFSVQLDWPFDTSSQWCGRLNPVSYKDVLDDLLGPVLHYGELPKLDRHINYRSELRATGEQYRSGGFRRRVGYLGVLVPRQWPDWLSENVDFRELETLAELPSAPEYFSRQATVWAGGSQGNFEWLQAWFGLEEEGGPGEALHRAITSTKRDCRRLNHGVYSRQAWIALHDNPMWRFWADRTPYWYDTFQRY